MAVPLFTPTGEVFGTLCGLDPEPRSISEETVDTLQLLAKFLTSQFEELERQESRQRFLGVLAHDLRSPLHAINLSAQVLHAQGLPAESTKLVQQILRSSQRMAAMIQELFDAVNDHVHRGEVSDPVDLDLSQLVEDAVVEQQTIHSHATFEVTDGTSLHLRGKPDLLQRLVGNLLANAVKYGDTERPISVALDDRGPEIALSVHNWGEPIAPEILPSLFQPFQRGPEDQDRDGLGLGLFIAAEAARAHSGVIDVESSEEKGTRFRVVLPKPPGAAKVLEFSTTEERKSP